MAMRSKGATSPVSKSKGVGSSAERLKKLDEQLKAQLGDLHQDLKPELDRQLGAHGDQLPTAEALIAQNWQAVAETRADRFAKWAQPSTQPVRLDGNIMADTGREQPNQYPAADLAKEPIKGTLASLGYKQAGPDDIRIFVSPAVADVLKQYAGRADLSPTEFKQLQRDLALAHFQTQPLHGQRRLPAGVAKAGKPGDGYAAASGHAKLTGAQQYLPGQATAGHKGGLRPQDIEMERAKIARGSTPSSSPSMLPARERVPAAAKASSARPQGGVRHHRPRPGAPLSQQVDHFHGEVDKTAAARLAGSGITADREQIADAFSEIQATAGPGARPDLVTNAAVGWLENDMVKMGMPRQQASLAAQQVLTQAQSQSADPQAQQTFVLTQVANHAGLRHAIGRQQPQGPMGPGGPGDPGGMGGPGGMNPSQQALMNFMVPGLAHASDPIQFGMAFQKMGTTAAMQSILMDPSLSMEDKIFLFMMLFAKQKDQEIQADMLRLQIAEQEREAHEMQKHQTTAEAARLKAANKAMQHALQQSIPSAGMPPGGGMGGMPPGFGGPGGMPPGGQGGLGGLGGLGGAAHHRRKAAASGAEGTKKRPGSDASATPKTAETSARRPLSRAASDGQLAALRSDGAAPHDEAPVRRRSASSAGGTDEVRHHRGGAAGGLAAAAERDDLPGADDARTALGEDSPQYQHAMAVHEHICQMCQARGIPPPPPPPVPPDLPEAPADLPDNATPVQKRAWEAQTAAWAKTRGEKMAGYQQELQQYHGANIGPLMQQLENQSAAIDEQAQQANLEPPNFIIQDKADVIEADINRKIKSREDMMKMVMEILKEMHQMVEIIWRRG